MARRESHLDPGFDRALREVLFDRKLPCPHCRYDLRGLEGTRCPECGNDCEAHMRVADLSPGRLRRQRIEEALRLVIRGVGTVVLASPVIAMIVFGLLVLMRE